MKENSSRGLEERYKASATNLQNGNSDAFAPFVDNRPEARSQEQAQLMIQNRHLEVKQLPIIQRQIKIGEENKSVAWLTVIKYGDSDSAWDVLKVIDAGEEEFDGYDALNERMKELSNLVKVFNYLRRWDVGVKETANSPFPTKGEGEDGINRYTREYIFEGVEKLLIHVHWAKGGNNKIDVAKAHFKSLSNKFETGKSIKLENYELKSMGLPLSDNERIKD